MFGHVGVYVMPYDVLVVPRERAREYRKEVAEVMVDSPIGAEREVAGVVICVDGEHPISQRKRHHRPPGSCQKWRKHREDNDRHHRQLKPTRRVGFGPRLEQHGVHPVTHLSPEGRLPASRREIEERCVRSQVLAFFIDFRAR